MEPKLNARHSARTPRNCKELPNPVGDYAGPRPANLAPIGELDFNAHKVTVGLGYWF